MYKRGLKSIAGLILLLTLGGSASGNLTQMDLPYNNVNILATATAVEGYYDDYDWINDGVVDTSITGSINSLLLSKEDAWLKIGFGGYDGPGGSLVFFADANGARKAYIQYTGGNINSNVVDLASFSLGGPLYEFTLTANEADNTFSATITDYFGTHDLFGDSVNDLTGVTKQIFAAGITQGADAKVVVDGTLTVRLAHAPTPGAIGLCGIGLGLFGWLRRRQVI